MLSILSGWVTKGLADHFQRSWGNDNTNYIINGDFSEEDLRKVLEKFIEKYICCPMQATWNAHASRRGADL